MNNSTDEDDKQPHIDFKHEIDSKINPIKNRLSKLLLAVKEETGSYADIRKKHRDRETERVVGKSRHQQQQQQQQHQDNNIIDNLSSSLPIIRMI